jgi:predicted Holliday junction resolvase-like endonuclease
MPIPEPLWAAAAELAREHGVFPTAKALHLEYGKLKERAEAPGQEKKAVRKARSVILRQVPPTAAPTFMELITPRSGSLPSAMVGLEGPDED